jgi:acyl-CoA synthetase (AMP-forming)/AMP-acid ligase II
MNECALLRLGSQGPHRKGPRWGRFGAPVLEAYGMTEAAHQMASNPLPPAARAVLTLV